METAVPVEMDVAVGKDGKGQRENVIGGTPVYGDREDNAFGK